jgi:hypothetical protein
MADETSGTEEQTERVSPTKATADNHHEFTDEEALLWKDAKCQEDYDAVLKMRDERWQREAQERKKLEWTLSEPAELLHRLGYAYTAYKACLDQQPNLRQSAVENDAENQKIYDRLRGNLERANNAPRCSHIKASGERCRAPKMRGRRFCNMHLAMQGARSLRLDLPALDDPNSIQLAIMKAAQGLLDGTLGQKQAAMLGYYLQLASNNVARVNFEPAQNDEDEKREEYDEEIED